MRSSKKINKMLKTFLIINIFFTEYPIQTKIPIKIKLWNVWFILMLFKIKLERIILTGAINVDNQVGVVIFFFEELFNFLYIYDVTSLNHVTSFTIVNHYE